nr:hypothetical protein [Bacillus altitudinis]
MKRVDEYRKKIAQRRKMKQPAAAPKKAAFKKKDDIPPWVMLTEEEKAFWLGFLRVNFSSAEKISPSVISFKYICA